jgi:ATP-binding cassette subfamily B protein
VLLLSNLFDPVQQLSQLYNTVQSAAASLHKLYGLIDTEPDVAEHPRPVELPTTGALVAHDLTFRYDGAERNALTHVSISVAPGERLALVGPTGAGKSTLAKLLSRLYDPTEGYVTFGDVDLRLASMVSLRERVVVVPQEGFLFGGTIRENIRIARPSATDDEVSHSLRQIGALDRFMEFTEGLDTEVRERGSRLSAGERQLISLARAALVDPAVLVLDEATSNLDPGTEAVVEHALEALMVGRTVIVVAHRLSTVQRADRIAVIDHAKLVELGTHTELVAEGGRYAALASAWARSRVRFSTPTSAPEALRAATDARAAPPAPRTTTVWPLTSSIGTCSARAAISPAPSVLSARTRPPSKISRLAEPQVRAVALASSASASACSLNGAVTFSPLKLPARPSATRAAKPATFSGPKAR